MFARNKIIPIIGLLGIVVLVSLMIVSACDNRRTTSRNLDENQRVSLSFRPSNLVVYSANKPDTVEIDIWVRDDNGMGIDSIKVSATRRPAIGTIIPPGVTSDGYACAIYITDPGALADPDNVIDSLIFTASTEISSTTDTLDVILSLQGEIASMNISAQKLRLTADGEDETKLYVSAIDTTGIPVDDNTVLFINNYGAVNSGHLEPPYGYTTDGIAEFTLTAPSILDPLQITETDSIRAWGISLSGDTTSAYAAITYQPDEPSILFIPPDSIPESMDAGSNEDCIIWVRVSDAHGSLVIDGTQVQFKKQLASSNITSLAITNNGWAQGVYSVGLESGDESIQAYIPSNAGADTIWSNNIPINIRSSEPTNIDLFTYNPTIEVGGISTQIYAVMQDENGNSLSDGFLVKFEITAAPSMDTSARTPSFNFIPTDTAVVLIDSTETNVEGRATIALFSGIKAGTVRIKATSIDDENILKEKPLVTIQSGPPAIVEIAPSNIASVEGEAITTGITALVWDEFTNPVECSTAVHFEVIPDTIAYIEGAAYTGGGVTDDGETLGTRGQAYTWMAYSCLHTFDTVRVEVTSGDMADTSGPIVLAIYDGTIVAYPNPGYLYVDGSPNYQDSDVEAQLLDGLGCVIHNGVITFTAQICGEIVGQTSDTTDYLGLANTVFRIYDYQIPPDPPALPHCTAKVNARLRGYADVEGECDIYCSKP